MDQAHVIRKTENQGLLQTLSCTISPERSRFSANPNPNPAAHSAAGGALQTAWRLDWDMLAPLGIITCTHSKLTHTAWREKKRMCSFTAHVGQQRLQQRTWTRLIISVLDKMCVIRQGVGGAGREGGQSGGGRSREEGQSEAGRTVRGRENSQKKYSS